MTSSNVVYSTSTDETPSFEGLSEELQFDLILSDAAIEAEEDAWGDFCFVCFRSTDHRGEHDDLVDEGKASYDPKRGYVYKNDHIYSFEKALG